jgi:hypothetical protein
MRRETGDEKPGRGEKTRRGLFVQFERFKVRLFAKRKHRTDGSVQNVMDDRTCTAEPPPHVSPTDRGVGA